MPRPTKILLHTWCTHAIKTLFWSSIQSADMYTTSVMQLQYLKFVTAMCSCKMKVRRKGEINKEESFIGGHDLTNLWVESVDITMIWPSLFQVLFFFLADRHIHNPFQLVGHAALNALCAMLKISLQTWIVKCRHVILFLFLSYYLWPVA